jgi:hypothetical protein
LVVPHGSRRVVDLDHPGGGVVAEVDVAVDLGVGEPLRTDEHTEREEAVVVANHPEDAVADTQHLEGEGADAVPAAGLLADVAAAAAQLAGIVDIDVGRTLEVVLPEPLARDRVLHALEGTEDD